MIDLNDVWSPPPRVDLAAVKAQLAATSAGWLPDLFPQARLAPDRRTLRCADLSGRAPRNEGSCIIHLDGPYAGWGFDFATGERAGPVDLIYHATGLTDGALFEEAARLAHMDRPVSAASAEARPHARGPPHPRRLPAARRQRRPRPTSAPADWRTRPRRISLYHPDLTDYDGGRGWPGMVAIPRRSDGSQVGGIHRTFLLEDGSAKAPVGKKMLGSVADGAVRLFPIGGDGHLGIAEGIETALAAQAMFGVPVWAALSADNLARWRWPVDVRRVTIFADAGEAGRAAAARLAERLSAAGVPNDVVVPLNGDDFNDDLRARRGRRRLHARLGPGGRTRSCRDRVRYRAVDRDGSVFPRG